MTPITLICLPFAGGARHSYNLFEQFVPDHIKLFPIELPGRATRHKEKLIVDIEKLVDDIFWQIFPKIQSNYAIYGHSMGTLLGYLLTKRLIKQKFRPPTHLFFTGSRGPSIPNDKTRHLLNRKDFIAELKELGGSPDEILANKSLLEYYEPIIRSDFQASETYVYKETSPFQIPMTIAIGKDEKTDINRALAWQKETTLPIDIIEYSGNHFFIFDHAKDLMTMIGEKIKNVTL